MPFNMVPRCFGRPEYALGARLHLCTSLRWSILVFLLPERRKLCTFSMQALPGTCLSQRAFKHESKAYLPLARHQNPSQGSSSIRPASSSQGDSLCFPQSMLRILTKMPRHIAQGRRNGRPRSLSRTSGQP